MGLPREEIDRGVVRGHACHRRELPVAEHSRTCAVSGVSSIGARAGGALWVVGIGVARATSWAVLVPIQN